MRAVRQHVRGEPLVVEEVPEPTAGPGEVVVEVARAGVNPIDVWIAAGSVAGTGPLPATPGGEGVGRTPDGRRVAFRGAGLGVTRDGTYAERVAVPEAILVAVPDGVDDAQAAAVGIAGVTAMDLVDLAVVEAGEVVLVLGASGGVGHLAGQIARGRGARVIGHTSTPARAEGLRRRTADDVVVAAAGELESAVRALAPEGVHVVLDGLAGPFAGPALRLLRPHGRAALYGASAGPEMVVAAPEFYRKRARLLGYGGLGSDPAALAATYRRVLDEIAGGRLEAEVVAELPLEEAEQAHRRIRAREVGGKLLLDPRAAPGAPQA